MRGEQEVQQLISIFICSKDRDIEGYLRKDAILFEKLGKSRTFFVYDEDAESFEIVSFVPPAVAPEGVTRWMQQAYALTT